MQIRDIEKLKVWLLKKLQPLCDADPAALSKYIIALLRKEKPRSALKELCINQLEVFLSKETPTFVEKLFRSLDNESYITGGGEDGDATPPLIVTASNRSNIDGGRSVVGVANSISPSLSVAPPPERIVTDHRRQSEDIRHREVDDDDRDFRRSYTRHDPALYSSSHLITTTTTSGGGGVVGGVANDKNKIRKKIEVDPPRRSIRQRLGNREDERRRRRVPRSRSRSRSSTPDNSHSPSTTPTNELEDRNRRKRLHGDIGEGKPVMKRQRCKDYDERGMCLLGEQCPFDHGNDPLVITGIPPYHPPFQLPMPPPPPPPPPHALPIPKGASGTDGYNPEDPSLTAGSNPSLPPPPLLPQMPLRPAFPPPPPLPTLPPGLHHPLPPSLHSNLPNPTLPSAFVPVSGQAPPIAPPTSSFVPVGGVRQPSRPSSSIVLRKIPQQLNTITKLSGYFEKFGTIVNLQVRYENDPESATVQFSSPSEAKSAHDCTEAVLNNRFIKVYYLKNTGGGGVSMGGANERGYHSTNNDRREVVRSIVPVSNKAPPTFQPITTISNNSGKQMTTPSFTPHKTTPTTTNTYPPTHSNKLQKVPPPQLTTPTAASMKRLELQKKSQLLLESQIKQQKLLLSKLEKGGKSLSTEEKDKIMETIKSLSSNINKLKDSLSSVTKAAANVKPHPPKPYKGRPPSLSSPTTPPSSLQQQADQLRNEAHKLGLLPSAPPTAPPPSSTNKKDSSIIKKKAESKSTSLLVVNVEDKDALVKYFESFGGLTKIERDPDNVKNVIFTFKNRTIAEKAAKGSLFQGKPLIMKWYTPKLAPPTITDTPTLTNLSSNKSDIAPPLAPPRPPSNDDGRIKYPTPPTSLSLLDEDLELHDDLLISVFTPEHTQPRVVHLLDDEEEELDERCWRH